MPYLPPGPGSRQRPSLHYAPGAAFWDQKTRAVASSLASHRPERTPICEEEVQPWAPQDLDGVSAARPESCFLGPTVSVTSVYRSGNRLRNQNPVPPLSQFAGDYDWVTTTTTINTTTTTINAITTTIITVNTVTTTIIVTIINTVTTTITIHTIATTITVMPLDLDVGDTEQQGLEQMKGFTMEGRNARAEGNGNTSDVTLAAAAAPANGRRSPAATSRSFREQSRKLLLDSALRLHEDPGNGDSCHHAVPSRIPPARAGAKGSEQDGEPPVLAWPGPGFPEMVSLLLD
ncbi:hypothetical protein TREES_T100014251 [Tupaia chinensis]|uniref:Uncharacterized protein n=1 Tax=Tupaia chinensis TaxID=246437 RepID=L9JE92_TUPCH|nr:hypothetical protein TREES_T100014251 [Tupaia chinensis]